MPTTIEIEKEIMIECECGRELKIKSSWHNERGSLYITTEPCVSCLQDERGDGYEEGREHGYTEGHDRSRREAISLAFLRK